MYGAIIYNKAPIMMRQLELMIVFLAALIPALRVSADVHYMMWRIVWTDGLTI